ncbi:MAG: DNA ligase, partial [Bacteroidetes bacterium]|nr:DNA ligase [Bacteroidota bacterium]
MPLVKYKEKRKFTKTPEPTGKKSSTKEELVFVVQKHDATNLHYDFRIEMDGVLLSWAIPKGPSMNPRKKRLAIMVEDHPFDYKDFEGIIPEGNYGAGAVIVWDEGTYYFEKGLSRAQNKKIFEAEMKKGHLTIHLKGKKLYGKFNFVRVKSRGENAWLMIKGKDEFATDINVLKENKSIKSGKTIEAIEQEAGVKPKAHHHSARQKITKQPALLQEEKAKKAPSPPQGIKPMLATAIDKPFNKKDWVFEIKWDGYRAMATVNHGEVHLYSRNDKSFNQKFSAISDALKEIKASAIFDGEVVALDDNGMPSFQLLQNYKDEELHLVYYIFDLLWLNGEDLRDLPLLERKEKLEELLKSVNNNQIAYSSHIAETGEDFFKVLEYRGLEGIMAKRAAGKYYSGRRTKEWLKIKTQKRQEAIICGYNEPQGSRKHFGSLMLGVYNEQGELQFIGSSGGGFDQNMLKDLKEKLDKLKTNASPFKNPPKLKNKITWVKPQL